MERFDIRIKQGNKEVEFKVREYLHHQGEKCRFEIFEDDKLVVSFNPDPHETLTVCSNPGQLDKQLVNLIADKLENYA